MIIKNFTQQHGRDLTVFFYFCDRNAFGNWIWSDLFQVFINENNLSFLIRNFYRQAKLNQQIIGIYYMFFLFLNANIYILEKILIIRIILLLELYFARFFHVILSLKLYSIYKDNGNILYFKWFF